MLLGNTTIFTIYRLGIIFAANAFWSVLPLITLRLPFYSYPITASEHDVRANWWWRSIDLFITLFADLYDVQWVPYRNCHLSIPLMLRYVDLLPMWWCSPPAWPACFISGMILLTVTSVPPSSVSLITGTYAAVTCLRAVVATVDYIIRRYLRAVGAALFWTAVDARIRWLWRCDRRLLPVFIRRFRCSVQAFHRQRPAIRRRLPHMLQPTCERICSVLVQMNNSVNLLFATTVCCLAHYSAVCSWWCGNERRTVMFLPAIAYKVFRGGEVPYCYRAILCRTGTVHWLFDVYDTVVLICYWRGILWRPVLFREGDLLPFRDITHYSVLLPVTGVPTLRLTWRVHADIIITQCTIDVLPCWLLLPDLTIRGRYSCFCCWCSGIANTTLYLLLMPTFCGGWWLLPIPGCSI